MKNTPPDNSSFRIFASYSLAGSLPVLAFLGHLYFPLFVDNSTVSILTLIGIGIASWTGGYKAGIIATVLFVAIINLPFAPDGVSSPFMYALRNVVRSLLILACGFSLSFLVDAGKRQEKIMMHKAREKEYKARIASLESENLRLKKDVKSREEFLSIASHELKTPLTSMLLQTQTALHNIRNVSLAHFSIDSLLKMLESVEHQTKRLSKMINDMFNISIMTTGNLTLETEKVDLNDIVRQVVNDFQTRIEKDNYSVILEFTEDRLVGTWDKVRVEQSIANLLSNAIKYGDKKPINIRTKKRGNYAELLIEDHGIGISKQKQREIFGLFERAAPSEEYKGLGVGLFITKQIAVAHGGSITVDSKLNEKTKFILKLPLS